MCIALPTAGFYAQTTGTTTTTALSACAFATSPGAANCVSLIRHLPQREFLKPHKSPFVNLINLTWMMVGMVITIAGSGQGMLADGVGTNAAFYYPNSIILDSIGTMYVGDYYNHNIRKISSAGAKCLRIFL